MRMRILVLWVIMLAGLTAQAPARVDAPHFWNDRELSDWATPIAGLNIRPGHFSEREYYGGPLAEWVRKSSHNQPRPRRCRFGFDQDRVACAASVAARSATR